MQREPEGEEAPGEEAEAGMEPSTVAGPLSDGEQQAKKQGSAGRKAKPRARQRKQSKVRQNISMHRAETSGIVCLVMQSNVASEENVAWLEGRLEILY